MEPLQIHSTHIDWTNDAYGVTVIPSKHIPDTISVMDVFSGVKTYKRHARNEGLFIYINDQQEILRVRFTLPETSSETLRPDFEVYASKEDKKVVVDVDFYDQTNISVEEAKALIAQLTRAVRTIEEPAYESIDSFIGHLQRISPEKRKLPLKIFAPNGTGVFPSIKMKFKEGTFLTPEAEVESMVITWRD